MRKRIILLCAVATAMGMQSCNVDQAIDEYPKDDLVAPGPELYHLTEGSAAGTSKFELADAIWTEESGIELRNPNSIVKANYTTVGNHLVRLSGAENRGGVHGSGRITGPIYVDVEFDVVCIAEIDNRATVGGEITAVELGDNPFEFPIQPGWIIYVAVEDNGSGAKSDADRYHTEVYFGIPGIGSFCDFLAPNNPFAWPADQWLDVTGDQDRILVK